MTPNQTLGVVLVALLWGGTNPFLRAGSEVNRPTLGGSEAQGGNEKTSIVSWFASLWVRWQFLLPFALNQCGSVLYAAMLGNADLTIVVPVCNALTFVITALTSYYIGEPITSIPLLFAGSVFILAGSFLCT